MKRSGSCGRRAAIHHADPVCERLLAGTHLINVPDVFADARREAAPAARRHDRQPRPHVSSPRRPAAAAAATAPILHSAVATTTQTTRNARRAGNDSGAVQACLQPALVRKCAARGEAPDDDEPKTPSLARARRCEHSSSDAEEDGPATPQHHHCRCSASRGTSGRGALRSSRQRQLHDGHHYHRSGHHCSPCDGSCCRTRRGETAPDAACGGQSFAVYDSSRYADKPVAGKDRDAERTRRPITGPALTDYWRAKAQGVLQDSHSTPDSVCSSSAGGAAITTAMMTSTTDTSSDSSALSISTAIFHRPTKTETPIIQHQHQHRTQQQKRPTLHPSPRLASAAPTRADTASSLSPLSERPKLPAAAHESANEPANSGTHSAAPTYATSDPPTDPEEASLRQQCARLCTCYWSSFPELPMPINPASHTPSCPARATQERYEAFMLHHRDSPSSSSSAEEGDVSEREEEKRDGEQEASSTTSCSRCGCFDCCCVCCGAGRARGSRERASVGQRKQRRSRDEDGARRGVCARCLAEQRVRELRRNAKQRASGPPSSPSPRGHEPAQVTATAVGAGRSAVMGTAKRRTAFDIPGERDAGTSTTGAASGEDGGKKGDGSLPPPTALSSVVAPGPGAYDVAAAFAHTSTAAPPRHASIGKALRPIDGKDPKAHYPGPGAYNVAPPLIPVDGAGGKGVGDGAAPGAVYRPPPQAPAPFFSSSARNLTYGASVSPYLKNAGTAAKEPEGAPLVQTSPGPGAYRPEAAFAHDARVPNPPAFSFPKASLAPSSATNAEAAASPGPGAYDVRTGKELGALGGSPAAGIPRAERSAGGSGGGISSSGAAAGAPHGADGDSGADEGGGGPASYAVEQAWKYLSGTGYAATFGAQPRRLGATVGSSGVGPGDYDADAAALAVAFARSPQWTIRGARDPRQSRCDREHGAVDVTITPGPGEYMPIYSTQPLHAPRGFYFGTAPRMPATPAAGDKEADKGGAGEGASSCATTARAWGDVTGVGWVSRAARVTHLAGAGAAEGSASPGPGAYAVGCNPAEPRAPHALLHMSAPRFRLSSSAGGVAVEDAAPPGPSTYEVEATLAALEHRTGAIIGTARRRGVGLFSAAFGRDEGDMGGAALDEGAGPGSYSLPALPTGPAYSFRREKSHDLVDLDIPGPGLYNLGEAVDASSAQRRAPHAVLTTTAARFPGQGEGTGGAADAPGPASYSVEAGRRGLGGSGPSPMFGTAPRLLGDAAARHKQEADAHVGPGSYEPLHACVSDRAGAGTVIGQAPRFPCSGPSPDGSEAHAGHREHSPGPAAYVTEGFYKYLDGRQESLGVGGGMGGLARCAPRVTEVERLAQQKGDVPGPGSYLPLEAYAHAGAPGVVFGSAPRMPPEAAADDTHLGPGAYNPLPAGRVGGGNAAIFGTAARDVAVDASAGPGPGTYEVYMTRDGQQLLWRDGKGAISFGSAPEAGAAAAAPARLPDEETPGPGAYLPLIAATRAAAGGAVFGTGPGHADAATETHGVPGLGPGAYDVQDGLRHPQPPAYTFGKALSTLPAPSPPFAAAPDGSGSNTGHGHPSPGPGAYLPISGPGISSVELPASRAVRIGTGPRFPSPARDGLEGGGGSDGQHVDGRPGPGAYSPSYALVAARAPAVRIGTSRSPEESSFAPTAAAAAAAPRGEGGGTSGSSPGPGSYAVGPSLDGIKASGPAFAFPVTPRFPTRAADGHGRGGGDDVGDDPRDGRSYDVSHSLQATLPTAPAYSFGRAKLLLLPGGLVATTAGGSADGADSTTPGPGFYQVDGDGAMRLLHPTAPSARFGTEAKACHAADAPPAPGPGDYSPLPAFPAGPQIAFGTAPTRRASADEDGEGKRRRGDGRDGAAPGPGSYDVAHPRDGPAFTIGGGGHATASRAATKRDGAGRAADAMPGPGAYDVLAFTGAGRDGPAVSVPRAPRFPADARSSTPSGRATATAAAGDDDDGDVGPGAYDLSATWGTMNGQGSTGPAVSFARARRPGPEHLHALDTPGPGHYDNAHDSIHGYGSGIATGAHGGGAAMRYTAARFPEGHGAATTAAAAPLGPGAYSPSFAAVDATSRDGPSFPQASRFPPALADGAEAGGAVGPGSYDIPLALRAVSGSGPAPVFGTASRGLAATGEKAAEAGDGIAGTPGPGAYNIRDIVGQDGPAYTIAGRRPQRLHTEAGEGEEGGSPGPGAYAVKNFDMSGGSHGRAAILLGRPAASSNAEGEGTGNGVGPGAYDTSRAIAATKPAAPAVHITGKPSFDAEESRRHEGPGPGVYDSGKALDYVRGTGPAFTLGGREGQRRGDSAAAQDVPGPASYDLPDPPRGLAAGFGTSPRMPPVAEADGGPGAYDASGGIGQPHGRNGSVAVSFPIAPRMPPAGGPASEGPGPGAYSLPGREDYTEWLRSKLGPSFGVGETGRGRLPVDAADIAATITPGPGAYEAYRDDVGHGRVATFGTGTRVPITASGAVLSRDGADGPGPGAYGSPYQDTWAGGGSPYAGTAGGVTFGYGARPDPGLPHARDTPGPGTYYRFNDAAGNGVGLGGALTPGPSFGFGSRPSPAADDHPGPGTYHRMPLDGGSGAWPDAVNGVSFGMADRPPLGVRHNTNPGPGAYYRAETSAERGVSRAPSFGLGERPSPVMHDHPGPGTYHKEEKIDGRDGVAFGVGERFPHGAAGGKSAPGPGDYFKDQPWGERVERPTIPKAERFPTPTDASRLPGPASYQPERIPPPLPPSQRRVRFHVPNEEASVGTERATQGSLAPAASANADRDAAMLAKLAKAGYPVKLTKK